MTDGMYKELWSKPMEVLSQEQLERNIEHERKKNIRIVTDRLRLLADLQTKSGIQKVLYDIHEQIFINTGLVAHNISTDIITNDDYCEAMLQLMEQIQ